MYAITGYSVGGMFAVPSVSSGRTSRNDNDKDSERDQVIAESAMISLHMTVFVGYPPPRPLMSGLAEEGMLQIAEWFNAILYLCA